MKIATIGTGTVGANWAALFAAAGHDVLLFDTERENLESGLRRAGDGLARLMATSPRFADGGPGSLGLASSLEEAVADADYVQESVAEDADIKRSFFEAIAALDNGKLVVGSSTSAIPGSQFMCALPISDRCLVVHPTNPSYIVPLVELCRCPETSDDTFRRVVRLLVSSGRVPIEVRRETTGYILNRLQAAVVGEALHLVGEGYVSATDLDKVMAYGLAPRWVLGGPFLAGHLNAPGGYADYMTRFGDVYRGIIADLDVAYAWEPSLLDRIAAELRQTYQGRTVEELQRDRDEALLQLEVAATVLRDL